MNNKDADRFLLGGHRIGSIITTLIGTSSTTTTNITDSFRTTTIPSYTSIFNSNIDEKLTSTSLTGYKYNGVDICVNAIATFIESSNTTPVNVDIPITIPSWCNKIRAILIGGGGSGGPCPGNVYTPEANHFAGKNRQENWVQDFYDDGDDQQTKQGQGDPYPDRANYNVNFPDDGPTGYFNFNDAIYNTVPANNNGSLTPGYGGGGGGFVYIDSIGTINMSTLKLFLGDSGGITRISINNNILYHATAGTDGTTSAVGEGGGWYGNDGVLSGIRTLGVNGSSSTGGNCGRAGFFTTYSNQGKGGNGCLAALGKGVTAGSAGNRGYYRIYFLIN